jgi:hypothetical protein
MLSQLSGNRTYLLVIAYLVTLGYQITTGEVPMDAAAMQEGIVAGMVASVRAGLAKISPTA